MRPVFASGPASHNESMTFQITNPWIFFGVAAVVVAYLLYTMIRKRTGERPGHEDREPLL
jgi:phosphate/sulfate permease